MFSDSNERDNHRHVGGLDQHQSKELGRYIASNRKKNIVLHSLLHNRCKFCVTSFSSTGCRNCCLPMCQDFKKVSTKKLIRNTVHNINGNINNVGALKKAIRPVGNHLEPFTYDFIEHSNPRSTSPRLSPSPSGRFNTLSGSNRSTNSPIPPINDGDELPSLDKMNIVQDHHATIPSAPSPGLVLFNNEEQSDLVFLVGKEEQKLWRFPAHSFLLKDVSPFFKAISSAAKEQREIRVNWVEPDTFHIILKYIYTNEVTIKSVSVGLALFNAANSFCLTSLSKLCLTFLCNECNDENVLEIVTYFHYYLKHCCELNGTKNVPDSDKANDGKIANLVDNEELLLFLNNIIIRCYTIIDYQARKIISSEEFANLTNDLVGNILWRDTLNISELEVFTAINQWASQQCKKTCKELTDRNRREVLGDLLYYPRYLVMSEEDFNKGPYHSELLTDEEKRTLLERIRNNDSNDNMVELPKYMQTFKIDVERRYVPMYYEDDEDDEDDDDDGTGSSGRGTPNNEDQNNNNNNQGLISSNKKGKKKKSKSKKILNGIGEVMLCVIKLLD
ncbi:hypothetical protein RDWZM_000172 [Blomia tropicalis]|uniref:BTB domain-containing protein n=1 Tax=Blomia tropicalis TaxID=40697 RepID=A0A9Q0MCB9_BLOTA|nr:hypothetical protein RDWZM_000172 [Blomia tropicalis]